MSSPHIERKSSAALRDPRWLLWPLLAMTLVVLWRHQDNIKRLLRGEEGSFKKTKAE